MEESMFFLHSFRVPDFTSEATNLSYQDQLAILHSESQLVTITMRTNYKFRLK